MPIAGHHMDFMHILLSIYYTFVFLLFRKTIQQYFALHSHALYEFTNKYCIPKSWFINVKLNQ